MMVREIEDHNESMAEQKLGGYSSRYHFTGKELDPLSGLYDFGARYYDPRLSVWFGVDPLAEKAPGWNPFRYGFNNPIRVNDPDGQIESEEEAKAYAKSHGIKIGWFRPNKINQNKDGKYSIDNKKDGSSTYKFGEYGVIKAAVVSEKKQKTHVKFANAVNNVLVIDPTKLSDPKEGPKQAWNAMKKEASIALNLFSLGEGVAALEGASALGKGIGLFGMANDANDLTNDLTGFNFAELALGEKGGDVLKAVNGGVGLASSVRVNLKNALPSLAPAIGNIGDVKDLNEVKHKYEKKKN